MMGDKRAGYFTIAVILIALGCHLFARFTWTDTWNRFLFNITTNPPLREADVPAAEVEMDMLVQTLLANNTDSHIGTRVYSAVNAPGGDWYRHCVRGTIGLVFQVTRPVEEVASAYASMFEISVRESVINPDLTYYDVFIDKKRELLLDPYLEDDFDPFLQSTPPPDVCRTAGHCYEIQVFYADPSNDSCRGG